MEKICRANVWLCWGKCKAVSDDLYSIGYETAKQTVWLIFAQGPHKPSAGFDDLLVIVRIEAVMHDI